jgi:hypothetical protein
MESASTIVNKELPIKKVPTCSFCNDSIIASAAALISAGAAVENAGVEALSIPSNAANVRARETSTSLFFQKQCDPLKKL